MMLSNETKRQRKKAEQLEIFDRELWAYRELLGHLLEDETKPIGGVALETRPGTLSFRSNNKWHIHIEGFDITGSPVALLTKFVYEIEKERLADSVLEKLEEVERKRSTYLGKKWWEFWRWFE